jgi:nucleotide-binding universal stress UspA family protein
VVLARTTELKAALPPGRAVVVWMALFAAFVIQSSRPLDPWRRKGSSTIAGAQMDHAHAIDHPIFKRILCGVDGTPESLVAVRQAARLCDPDGSLQLTAVVPMAKAIHAGFSATRAAELMQEEAEAALAEARALAPSAIERLVNGEPVPVLLHAAEQATLVAVGSHGRGRAAGMLLGTVAARMLRDAPCSVLISRAAGESEVWPRSVVVGVDGSAESAAAFSVARSIAERFGVDLRAVASTTDHLDPEAARAIAPQLEEEPARAADALAAASESEDVIVVGSRGLHGLKALGSVSERVAYGARSPVLVVRPAMSD